MEYSKELIYADKALEVFRPERIVSLTYSNILGELGLENQEIERGYILAGLRRLVEDKYLSSGGANNDYYDSTGTTFAFKSKGGYKTLVEAEKRKIESEAAIQELSKKSTQSVIDTNISIQELNKKTGEFYSKQEEFLNKQRTHNLINIGLTIAIMLATIVSGAIATCTYYDSKVERQNNAKDKSDLQVKVSHIDSTLQSKMGADTVFQKAVKDSLNIP